MVEGWRRSKQNGREIRNGIIALRWCTSEEDFDGKTSMSLARVAVPCGSNLNNRLLQDPSDVDWKVRLTTINWSTEMSLLVALTR